MVLPPSMQSSLPVGWLAFTGRELNPLDRDEGFQITSSFSLPGLFLAQRPKTCTKPDSCTATKGFYSIASSATASSESGTVRPSAFAVLRLITTGNLAD
jgi:hypothetical protein